MPLSTKAQLPDTYIPIKKRYLDLLDKADRTTSGNRSEIIGGQDFTITDNTGETGLLKLLQQSLYPYNVESKNYNEIINTVNDNVDKIIILNQSTDILTPSGTANAIVVPVTLVNKKKYSFKAIATSTGTVTINGIPFKKSDGTVIGNGGVKINRVYDFYWDSSVSSVFILTKAEGNLLVGDALVGSFFSTSDDINLEGTMIERGTVNITPSNVDLVILGGKHSGNGVVSAVTFNPSKLLSDTTIANTTGTMKKHITSENRITPSVSVNGTTPTVVYVAPEEGFFGFDSHVQITEPNHIASNYLAGKTYFGLEGTAPVLMVAGTAITIGTQTGLSTTSTTMVKMGQRFTMNLDGSLRIKFTLGHGGQQGNISYARVYKNGVAIGALRSVTYVTNNIIYTEDFTCHAGDYFEIYGYTSDAGGYLCNINNNVFSVCNVTPCTIS
jgi:hypothetical protein